MTNLEEILAQIQQSAKTTEGVLVSNAVITGENAPRIAIRKAA